MMYVLPQASRRTRYAGERTEARSIPLTYTRYPRMGTRLCGGAHERRIEVVVAERT
jgi:hypothetical protein